MYVFSADMFTIRQKGIRKAASRQEHPLKTSRKTGFARHAESARNTSKRNFRERGTLWPVDNFFSLIAKGLCKKADYYF